MPAWLLRVVWKVRGKRRVRVHLVGRVESFDGVQIGRWGGAYYLIHASFLKSEDESITLDGVVELLEKRVDFVQVIS